MNKNGLLLSTLILFATVSRAEDLLGIFEIPQVEGEENFTAKVETKIDDEGTYSARVVIGEFEASSWPRLSNANFSLQSGILMGGIYQVWRVSLEQDEVTILVQETYDTETREHTWTGKLSYDLEGTFEFPPSEGETGDTIGVRLFKNDEDNYSVEVLELDETVHATNVTVIENQFTFNTPTNTPDGEMSQSWSVEITNGKIILTELSDTASSISREGRFVEKELAGEVSTFDIHGPLMTDLLRHFSGTLEDSWLEDDPFETIKVQVRRDTMGNFSVQVSMENLTIDATNVKVSGNVLSFDTEFNTVIGPVLWSWKTTVEDDEVTVLLASNQESDAQAVTLSGSLLQKEGRTNIEFGQTTQEFSDTQESSEEGTESVEQSQ